MRREGASLFPRVGGGRLVLWGEYFGFLGFLEAAAQLSGGFEPKPPSEDGGDANVSFGFSRAGEFPRPTKVGGSLARRRADQLLSRETWGTAGRRFAVPARRQGTLLIV